MPGKSDYEWLTEMGLCHRCRKKKVVLNRKFCSDCLYKISEENAKRYNPEKAKEYQHRRRHIYREKKEKGICVRCSKKATHGLYCYECSIKVKRRSSQRAEKRKSERHKRNLIPEQRRKEGLCLWCGQKAIEGANVCERHRKIFSEAGRKGKEQDKAVEGFWENIKNSNVI